MKDKDFKKYYLQGYVDPQYLLDYCGYEIVIPIERDE